MNTYLLRLVACLFVLLSFNAKALVINGCTIEPGTECPMSDLFDADLAGADLRNADLSRTNLAFANLSDANLSGAYLHWSNLSGANLSYADLSNSTLFRAYLGGSNLQGANLSGAYINLWTISGATYNESTELPFDFDHQTFEELGMIFVSEVPLPAGIYLFLSGLVGLVGVKLRGRYA